ncbi:uncharacterized protein Z518_06891 [Rhinocladiella mackenziei CBS 650.93]|uniref:AAA+ ATPase domain-containing protein n=1 Tax=Rhinocladiella mackenziei CBS 650.93 TaxID=1442369 RepID=A0A0D2IBZ8_9EURO|nr:uncharacterized protein Z518_06891 [Rhinocladiella mackenziei CBS 650.93]KIX03339.1 hypothetical protein Z518_06891 [Rhinocladiella mackenziei CBS 650.93]
MASKFMVNAAFDANARLLLRLSRQHTVLFVNKLEYPIPGRPTLPPILGSRSFSDSTSSPSFPKSSGSSKDSQFSGPKDKNRFSSETWDKTFTGYVTQEMWKDWYQGFRRRAHESARESAIYDQLKKGPVFKKKIRYVIPRQQLVDEIRLLVKPTEDGGGHYPVIIGEHGTGKTSLIELAVNSIEEPKGIVYVDVPVECSSEFDVARAMQKAMGWKPDDLIDSGEPASVETVVEVFTDFAIKYQQEFKTVPVLIIDNVNRLSQTHQRLLDLFQDYAKKAADQEIFTIVFVSSEGRVPRPMTDRSSWSRRGEITEIGDVTREEALQYLRLRKVDDELATQIYQLVGAGMIHLQSVTNEIEKNRTFEVARRTMFSDAERQLPSAEVLPHRRYHKEGAVIIRELLKNGTISWDTFYDLVGANIGDKLLEAHIFALHSNSEEITFQSTVMKRYCEENLALWEGN